VLSKHIGCSGLSVTEPLMPGSLGPGTMHLCTSSQRPDYATEIKGIWEAYEFRVGKQFTGFVYPKVLVDDGSDLIHDDGIHDVN